MPRLLSIQIGLPRTYGDPAAQDPHHKQWHTGFFKTSPPGGCEVTPFGLEGDGQADLRFHGGPDKAVLAYSADHYPQWRTALSLPEMTGGGFGENLTIESLDEKTVCIGDLWQIGPVQLQVSQPRQPCWKLARRWEIPELPKLVIKTGRSGWYLRIVKPGRIEPGLECELVERPHPEWSIDQCNHALYDRHFRMADAQELAALPELSAAWQEDLLGRIGARDFD